MNQRRPETFDDSNKSPVDTLAIRDTVANTGREIAFGIEGWRTGILSIVNGLNQSVDVTVQVKNSDGDTWRALASATTVASTANGNIGITVPWGMIRISAICSVAPVSGNLLCTLVRVRT